MSGDALMFSEAEKLSERNRPVYLILNEAGDIVDAAIYVECSKTVRSFTRLIERVILDDAARVLLQESTLRRLIAPSEGPTSGASGSLVGRLRHAGVRPGITLFEEMDSRPTKPLTNAERDRLKCSALGNTSMLPTHLPKPIRDRFLVPPRKSKE